MGDVHVLTEVVMRYSHAVLLTLAATSTLTAQLDRELRRTVGSQTFLNQSIPVVSGLLQNGTYRLTDLEVTNASPLRFSGTMVENTGDYAVTSWNWHHGLTSQQLVQAVGPSKRLIDVERYVDGGGNTRYAAITIDNTGPSARTSWYLLNVDRTTLDNFCANNNARVIDIETHFSGRSRRLDAIMIENSGADQRAWSLLIDATYQDFDQHLDLQRHKPIDIERETPNIISAVTVFDNSPLNWRYYRIFSGDVFAAQSYHLARAIDVEPSGSGWDVLLVDNYDTVTDVGYGCGGLDHNVYGSGLIDSILWLSISGLSAGSAYAVHLDFSTSNVALDVIGATGCGLFAMPTLSLSFWPAPANGSEVVNIQMPADPLFVGLDLTTQFVAQMPGANPLGIATSNGVRTRIRG